jgi:hypothetical protein
MLVEHPGEMPLPQGGGHPLPGDITDEFANQLIDAINKGIIALCRQQGGSPSKKLKGNDGNPQG